MMWHDLKQAVAALKPSSVTKLKLFWMEQWTKMFYSDVIDSLPVITDASLQKILT